MLNIIIVISITIVILLENEVISNSQQIKIINITETNNQTINHIGNNYLGNNYLNNEIANVLMKSDTKYQ